MGNEAMVKKTTKALRGVERSATASWINRYRMLQRTGKVYQSLGCERHSHSASDMAANLGELPAGVADNVTTCFKNFCVSDEALFAETSRTNLELVRGYINELGVIAAHIADLLEGKRGVSLPAVTISEPDEPLDGMAMSDNEIDELRRWAMKQLHKARTTAGLAIEREGDSKELRSNLGLQIVALYRDLSLKEIEFDSGYTDLDQRVSDYLGDEGPDRLPGIAEALLASPLTASEEEASESDE